jgi:3-phenylpropionate/cinnamic acid dioxygenase small subunit
MDDATATRYLLDRVQIEDLAKRYAHAIDGRDWDAVDACFAVDAFVQGTQSSGPYPAYIAGLRVGVESYRTTMHFFGNQRVDIDGDSAHLVTYGIAYHLGSADGTADFVIGVRYIDDVVRSGEGWIIAKRTVQGIWRRAVGAEVVDLSS